MATKMGQKRVEPRQALRHTKPERMILYNTTISPVSQKHAAELREYNKLIKKLREFCSNKSEISGKIADWQSDYIVDPHHITGRIGNRLLNPFNIVFALRSEHEIMQDTMSYENKLYLLKYIKPIRLSQGFKEEDYEALV